MACLGECDDVFPLSVLQKALKANTFSKWLSRIQIAEIEKAAIDGLEQCPFCPFATIMDTTPEENKLFACQNPDCGKGTIFSAEILCHVSNLTIYFQNLADYAKKFRTFLYVVKKWKKTPKSEKGLISKTK